MNRRTSVVAAFLAGCVAASADSAWPTYHGEPGLCGAAHAGLPAEPAELWRFKADSPVSLAPASDGKRIFFVSEKGTAFAIDMTGTLAWSAGIEPPAASPSNTSLEADGYSTPPLAIGNAVVIGSRSGFVHALDAATGGEKWKFKAGERMLGSANRIGPDAKGKTAVAVLSSADGVLRALNPETGEPLWKTPETTRSDGSPAVEGGFVAFGSCDSAFHVFSSDNGTEIGTIKFDECGQVAGGVALAGGFVFAGTRLGYAVCANAAANKLVWTNRFADAEAFTTPAVSGNRVVIGAGDGTVCCLNKLDGARLWAFTGEGAASSPAIAGNKVVVSCGGTLYVLGFEDGGALWSSKCGDSITSPAVFDGRIVVGTDEGFIIAYGAKQKPADR